MACELVERWVTRKNEFHHKEIVITAGPYRSDVVAYTSKDGVMALDFYSAFRNGFGSLSEQEVAQIIELL